MKMIGVIIPGLVNENYLGGIYRGIADTAKQNHCQLLTSIQNARRQDDLRYFFGRGGCDGAVLVAPYDYERMIDLCEQANCPCVLIDYTGARDAQMFPRVEVRNHEGITLVMEHLVRLGHRRIGFITGLMTQQSAQERLDGYRDGLSTAGIAYDPALVASGSWLPPENYTAAKALFQLDPLPTAIVASCDFGAFATYRVAQERGLVVGKDISISGFDDIRSASLADPPLTTIRQPIYRMGQVAVEMLVKRLKGEVLCETYVRLETELILRKSTGAVPTNS